MTTSLADEFRTRGFVVLRGEVDPGPLSDEIDRALAEGARADRPAPFEYVPMMCERTPVSLDLVDRFAAVASQLLGRAVLPGRAKGTRYHGDTDRHRDSTDSIATLGCVAYLDPVDASNGALRVIAGSHLHSASPAGAGEPIETEPGDVIVFDERLLHGSSGGADRRQWRVDFVIDPHDAHERASVERWFAQSIPNEQDDPGYDPQTYPSYGAHWQTRDRPWTARLADLGVYRRAAGEL
jgi:hypothetical protein